MKTLRFSGLSLSLITLSAVLLWSTPSFCPLTFGQGSSLKARVLTSNADAQAIIDAVNQASVSDKDPGVKVLAKHFGATDKATLLAKLREKHVALPDLVAAEESEDDESEAAPAPAPEAGSDKLVDAAVGRAHPAVAAVAEGTAAAGAREAGRAESSARAIAIDASATAAAASEALKPVAAAAAAGVIPAADAVAARVVVLEAQLAASVALVAARDATITEKDRQIGEATAAKDAAVAARDAAAAAAATAAGAAAARIAELEGQLASEKETSTETAATLEGYQAVMKDAVGGNVMDASGTLTERAKVIYNGVQAVIDAGVTV